MEGRFGDPLAEPDEQAPMMNGALRPPIVVEGSGFGFLGSSGWIQRGEQQRIRVRLPP